MIAQAVGISIAGEVTQMVARLPLGGFFWFVGFFCFYIMSSLLWYKNSHAALGMA